MTSRLRHFSAGIQDSALTIHGNLQADRLGRYFAQAGLHFTNIFSSDLQRAYKTAEAIRLAQDVNAAAGKLEVAQLAVLREQDFGIYEGKPFHVRQRISKASGKGEHRYLYSQDPVFKDVESKESMNSRMDSFIQAHLLLLLPIESPRAETIVAVVSHGIILSHLWRCFLKRFPKNSVTLGPDLTLGRKGSTALEYLGGWSNTGYLELDIQPMRMDGTITHSATDIQLVSQSSDEGPLSHRLPIKMTVKAVNGKEHLKSLKRTRGGVGSSKYDEGQTKIEAFFKKTNINLLDVSVQMDLVRETPTRPA